MAPRRRTLLTLLGGGIAGLAGCSALSEREPEPTPTDEHSPAPTETATPVDPDPVPVEGTWPTFQADAARTGSAPDLDGPADHPVVNWRTDTWGLVTSPVVDDDTVYAASGLRDRYVHAVDVETGEERWRRSTDGRSENVLTVADGVVYVGMDRLYALDAETGEPRWDDIRDVREGIALADGRVIAPSDATHHVHAFDATTGDELWEQGAPGRTLSATAVPAVHDGTVYLGSHEDLYTLDLETGDRGWRRDIGERVDAAPTVTDDLVYVPTQGPLLALERDGGDEVWRLGGRFRNASPAVDGETLYVGGRVQDGGEPTPALVALDAATGDEQWRLERDGFVPGSPLVAGDTVYVTSRANRLFAVDAAAGDVRWTLQFEWGLGTPALLEDGLAVSAGGRLYFVERGPDADARPWAGVVEPTGKPDVSDPDYPGSDFYFGTHGYDVTATAEVDTEPDAPFEFTVDVTGDRIDADEQVTMEFALTNTGDEPLTIEGGAPMPFGVVTLSEVSRNHRSLTAWSESYEDGHVHWSPHRGYRGVNDILLSETIPPGETVSDTYVLSTETHQIQPDTYSFGSGYTIHRGDSIHRHDDDGEVWNPSVYVRVDLEQPAPETGDTALDVAVTDESDAPEEFIGRFSVDVLEPVGDATPGLVEIALENADGLGSVASLGDLPFASYVGLAEDGSWLLLMDEEMFAPAHLSNHGDGTWTPTIRPHVEHGRGWSSRRFEADDRFARRYLVVSNPDSAEPLTPGDYVFENGYADNDGTAFTWRFQLSLRERNA